MSELSEAPPTVVDPVQWLVRSVVDTVEPLADALPAVPAAPTVARPALVDAATTAPRPRHAVGAVLQVLVQAVLLAAVAVGYAVLEGGSAALSVVLVPVVLALVVTGRSSSVTFGGAGATSALNRLVVGYAVVSLAVVMGAVESEALPQAAVLFAAGAVLLAGTALVRGRRQSPAKVLVVGDRSAVSRAAMQWGASDRVDVVGGVLTDRPVGDGRPVPVVGVPTVSGLESTFAHLRRCQADLVLVAPGPGLSGSDVRQLSWELEGTGVELGVLGLVDHAAPHRVRAAQLDGGTVLRMLPTRPSWAVRAAKNVVDRVLGGLLLLAALPVIGLLMLVVRLDSPGPGLFRQTRTGRDEELFTMLKLRTMHVDADRDLLLLDALNEADGPLFKIQDDPRITRVGRVLRRTSLDELPQLINVVRGEMSLVGPRPALPSEVASYDEVERRRLHVRPGLTGLWQVSGRSDLGWDTGMALDLRYADNWRLRGDASILARTFGAVLRRRGAY